MMTMIHRNAKVFIDQMFRLFDRDGNGKISFRVSSSSSWMLIMIVIKIMIMIIIAMMITMMINQEFGLATAC